MTAIWQNDESGWRLLAATGFPTEAELHTLVEQAPHLLPLAGSPRLSIVGREVLLGGNSADLIAIEPTGKVAIIELKLSRNAEARRAVVAQILTYAAFLKGTSPEALETTILQSHLQNRGFANLAHAAMASDQSGDFDEGAFQSGLIDCLSHGHFRLVLVLDEAPAELIRLIGYLESVTEKLVIDLITVASFTVGGKRIVVPRRIEPEHVQDAAIRPPSREGTLLTGSAPFWRTIDDAPPAHKAGLRQLAEWAEALHQEGLVRLDTYQGKGRSTLLPRLRGPDVGLVTVWNDGGAYLSLWRSVFEKYAPASIATVEALIAPTKIGQGNTLKSPSSEILSALTAAYREAVTSKIDIAPVET